MSKLLSFTRQIGMRTAKEVLEDVSKNVKDIDDIFIIGYNREKAALWFDRSPMTSEFQAWLLGYVYHDLWDHIRGKND